jgi:drug/metabolite transporter (DMT)-like permease
MTLDTLLGVAAATAAAVCFDGAVVLQAQDARMVDPSHALRPSLLARLVVRRRWLAGTALALLGVPLHLLAFAFAPVTVVQPTLALGMLLLLAAGTRLLGEPVGRREWLAASAIVVGVALLAAASPRHTDHLPRLAEAAVPVAVLAAAVVAPFVAGGRRAGAWLLIGGAGCAFALSAVCGKLLVTELAAGRPWSAAALLVAGGACSAVGLLVDMTALQRFEATRVAPPMFVIETAVPVALAPWLFAESWRGTVLEDAALAAGLLLVLVGGGLLGASRPVAGLESLSGDAGEGEHPVGGMRPLAVGEVGPPG